MRQLITIAVGCLFLGLGTATVSAQSRRAAELIKDLSDKNAKVRLHAAEELGRLAAVKLADAQSALPALKTAQKKDPDPGVRKAALEALGIIEPETKTYLPLLIDTVKRDRDPLVLSAASAALAQLGPQAKSALPALTEAHKATLSAQKDTKDPMGARAALVNALVKIDPEPKKMVPVYIDVLKRDRNLNNRLQTVIALGQIGPPAKPAIPALLAVQKEAKQLKDKDMGLAKETEETLKKIQAPPK
jgi:HEAT repeat protein